MKIQDFTQTIKEWMSQDKKGKWKAKLLWALLVAILLWGISFHYLYSGLNKRLILFTGICLLIGYLFAFPIPEKLKIPATVLYLLYVPYKTFTRMELPIHDMALMRQGAALVNVMIILVVLAVAVILFQRVHLGLGIGGILLLLLFLINFYTTAFRGSGIGVNDLLAAGTALTVLDHYKLFLEGELWYSILYFILFILWGFRCLVPIRDWRRRVVLNGVALCLMGAFALLWFGTDYLEKHELKGSYWNMADNEKLNGFLLSFGLGLKENTMEKPEGYSERALEELAIFLADETADVERHSSVEKPNIIFIMNEAWSDLRTLGNLRTSKECMSFVDSLSENTTKGSVYVNVLGGMTANSEFEALTGCTMAFLPANSIPYQLQVNHPMPSIVSVLEEQGYQTMAMHPNDSAAWNRDKVYNYFGFDEFIYKDIFETEPVYLRGFLSDQSNFDEIIYRYEHRDKDRPFFLFDVTIQTHSDYNGGLDEYVDLLQVGESTEGLEDMIDAQTYLTLIRHTDLAFEKLLHYFAQVEEPTSICMFGDHQPNLNTDFYEKIFAGQNLTSEEETILRYRTPYVIWSNYDRETPEYSDISVNYLGALLLNQAGIEGSPYYDYLMTLMESYPDMSRFGEVAYHSDQPIRYYRMLQYNQLIDQKTRLDLFQ